MFSGASFGEFSFSEQQDTPLDAAAWVAFLEEVTAERCWLLEVDAFSLATSAVRSAAFSGAAFGEVGFGDAAEASTGGVVTQHYSTHGYRSQAADTPAYTWYDGRLRGEEITVDRRLAGRVDVGGLAEVFAEAKLINADGALDLLTEQYALDGRPVRIYLGRPTDARADFGLVFSGVVAAVVIGEREVTLRLSDGAAKLSTVLNSTVYAGTGGTEGGADLKGKPKPTGWGPVKNITPPLVDSANLIYQVHDGAIAAVSAVYDRGVPLAEVGSAPGAGEYSVDTAAGTFTVGVTPSGTVTCDAQLDASGSGYVSTTADIVFRILTDRVGLYSTEIEPASFANLDTAAPADVGIWSGTEFTTARQVIDELLRGVGAFGGFNRRGELTVGQIAAAAGAEQRTFTDDSIVDVTREPLPSTIEPRVWRATVGYAKNYTVQTDLAGGVSAAQRTFAAEPYRTVKSEDGAVKSRHLLAKEHANLTSTMAEQADAEAEALRLFTLWSSSPALYRIRVGLPALTCDLGSVVRLEHSRHGMALGVPGRVLGHALKGAQMELLTLC